MVKRTTVRARGPIKIAEGQEGKDETVEEKQSPGRLEGGLGFQDQAGNELL